MFPQDALNEGVRKREVFGWAMYDFANSGYTTVVLTAVFNAYFVGAVAGAVADEIITYFRLEGITRAYVNNGGDIALHLTAGQCFRVGLAEDTGGKGGKHESGQRRNGAGVGGRT